MREVRTIGEAAAYIEQLEARLDDSLLACLKVWAILTAWRILAMGVVPPPAELQVGKRLIYDGETFVDCEMRLGGLTINYQATAFHITIYRISFTSAAPLLLELR